MAASIGVLEPYGRITMQRIELRNDRSNTAETVADYLGVSKRTVLEMASGKHKCGKTLPFVEVMPKVLRFHGEDIRKWEQANYVSTHTASQQ
tara:strand:+ start:117 stop:392 length:276 start_codon:yes stop_codon:yes gene_type:complete